MTRNIVAERDGPRPREMLIEIGEVETLFGGAEALTPVPEGEWLGDEES